MDLVRFRLAPMSGLIAVVTWVLLAIPAGMVVLAATMRTPILHGLVGFFVVLYAWIWLWMRPSAFQLSRAGLEIVWPLRQRRIPRSQIVGAELVTPVGLKREFGTLMRVGAGGLWGGFGGAWSIGRAWLGLYVSRHADGLVLVRCRGVPSLLITPADPERFVAAVAQRLTAAS
jgi:hypothetical protein